MRSLHQGWTSAFLGVVEDWADGGGGEGRLSGDTAVRGAVSLGQMIPLH